jgi:non-specific serine/threonine protein kinase
MLSPGTTLQGRYRVEEELGRGGMGAVYRAVDLRFGSTVALKQMTVEGAALRAAFEREARLLNGLRHRALPMVMDYFSEDASYFLVMQFIPGDDLGQLLVRAGRPFAPETVAAWADQLLGALEYLHSRVPPVVHRDIKPQNLKLTPEGELILLDFGLAKGLASQISGAQSLVGFTPSYAPLEQMRGEGTDPSGDVYAASATLYHLLTGVLPPDALRRAEAAVAGDSDPLVPARVLNATIPAALAELVAAGLAMSRRRRPSVAEMREGLRAAMASTVAGLPPRVFDPSGDLGGATTLAADTTTEGATGALDAASDVPTAPLPAAGTNEEAGVDTIPNNLPHAVTSFVGRERELDDVVRHLERVRLVTLAGPGGVGKTRLALRAAAGALASFPDGVWFVDLTAARDRAGIPMAFATACGVREEPGASLTGTLARALRDRRTLLVVDNCEHVVVACGEFVEHLLRSCPRVKALATSREPLGVGGELVWQLEPLAVPPEKADGDVLAYDAVALFRDRAMLARPSFEVTAENAAEVAEVCRKLEGLPLAIELAAARVRTLPVDQIRARLSDRLSFLTKGPRTAAPRHQTLRAAIDWSHDLLAPVEKAVFRRLAVFGDGWTLDAAKAICAGGPIAPDDVADLLDQLVDKSLVTVGGGESGTRYRLLESVHQYASEKLADAGEDDEVRRRHRDYFSAFAERVSRKMGGPEVEECVAKLEAERQNLAAALLWTRAEGDLEALARTVKCLAFNWYLRGHWSEWVWFRWLAGREDLPDEIRAEVLPWLGEMAYLTGDYEQSENFVREALELRRSLGDLQGAATSLLRVGGIAQVVGDHECARACYEESLALSREIDNTYGVGSALHNMAGLAIDEEDYDRAERLFEESREIFESLGGTFLGAYSIPHYMAKLALVRGDLPGAAALVASLVAKIRQGGLKQALGWTLVLAGDVAREDGRPLEAAAHYAEAVRIQEELGDRMGFASGLAGLATAAAALGHPAEALRLAGHVAAIREKYHYYLSGRERNDLERYFAPAREALGEAEARLAQDEGAAMTTADARAFAERLVAASTGA